MFHKRKSWFVWSRPGIVVVFLLAILPASFCPAIKRAVDPFTQNRKLRRGVNIIGYDPIWRSMDRARFKKSYFQMIKDAGFSTVRINLHPFRHMDRDNNYTLSDSWWKVLDWAVEYALNNDLMVILDLHEFGAMGKEPEQNKDRFLAFWRQVSERLKDAPANVLFEILNEPSRKLNAQMWNDYYRQALAIIRKTNPVRTVIIGPAHYNSIGGLNTLKLPEDDRNIILTVHYYSPMDFTHQGASWAGRKDKIGVEWKGTAEEKAAVERDFAKAQAWAKKHNRPVLLGEFGVYDKAPMESRLRYLKFITRTMEKFGWSWAYWQFDSDFILYDVREEKWVEPVRDALIPDSADIQVSIFGKWKVYKDIKYDTKHKRNVLDFYQADSETPTPVVVYFHGGGFRRGDKGHVSRGGGRLLKKFLEAGISVASCNYPFIKDTDYMTIMQHCGRSIQFIRSKPRQWNIDPKNFGAYGVSAGALISEWVAYSPDIAKHDSKDPVDRLSKSLAVVGAHLQPMGTEDLALHFMKQGGPPIFIYANSRAADKIHDPKYSKMIKQKADELSIPAMLVGGGRNDIPTAPNDADPLDLQVKFFVKYLSAQ